MQLILSLYRRIYTLSGKNEFHIGVLASLYLLYWTLENISREVLSKLNNVSRASLALSVNYPGFVYFCLIL